jgi:anti-sigma regulatory factor (Ser/Thr protein kinase)
MAKKSYSFELKSSLSELDRLCQNLETFGNKFGFSKKLIFEINLALDELFTNIISYGFKDNDDGHIIKVTLTPEKDELCLCMMTARHLTPSILQRPMSAARLRNVKSADWAFTS